MLGLKLREIPYYQKKKSKLKVVVVGQQKKPKMMQLLNLLKRLLNSYQLNQNKKQTNLST